MMITVAVISSSVWSAAGWASLSTAISSKSQITQTQTVTVKKKVSVALVLVEISSCALPGVHDNTMKRDWRSEREREITISCILASGVDEIITESAELICGEISLLREHAVWHMSVSLSFAPSPLEWLTRRQTACTGEWQWESDKGKTHTHTQLVPVAGKKQWQSEKWTPHLDKKKKDQQQQPQIKQKDSGDKRFRPASKCAHRVH